MSKERIYGFTLEELLVMDPDVLAAVLRGKGHINIEYPLYQALSLGNRLPATFGRSFRELLEIWNLRNLPQEGEDIQWCYRIHALCKQYIKSGELRMDQGLISFSEAEQQTVEKLVKTRRSIRCWSEEPISDELLEKVMEAGLWAPHSCNLQTIKYLVLNGEEIDDLLQARRLKGNHTCILVAQDMRLYDCFTNLIPPENQNLECGAAVQNMLLCAHSLGLGAVWLTFEEGEAQALKQKYGLPQYIVLKTYIALGWPAQVRLPPGRKSIKDAMLSKGSRTNQLIITKEVEKE